MGIVAKCPISLKMTPLKGRGCTSPNEYQLCLRTLRLSIKNRLIQVCARVSKKQEMAENLVFGALPLSLGVPNFLKLV